MGRSLAAALVVLAVLGAAPAEARQDDPRLDALFEELAATGDAGRGAALGRAIAAIWRQSGRPDIDHAMRLGRADLAEGDHDAAFSRYDWVVRLAPDYAEGWNQRAHVHFLRGEPARSIRDIRRALALEPRHFLALAGLGLVYLSMGDERAALDAFERALEINPHLPGTRSKAAELRARFGERRV